MFVARRATPYKLTLVRTFASQIEYDPNNDYYKVLGVKDDADMK